jgi:hypothetical protein
MTTIDAKRGYIYPQTVQLLVWECNGCGIVYGVPEEWATAKRKAGGSVCCPNGCRASYTQSEASRQRQRAERAERQAENAENAARIQRVRAEAEQRRASAYKGQATKIRNRIAQGVCPVPGCRRSGFSQVMRHIEAKHPSWAAEHVHGASGDE